MLTGDTARGGRAGQYNEQVFKAIDFILNEMGKQGIKVIVALVDYWKKTDGVQQVGASACVIRKIDLSRAGYFLPQTVVLAGAHEL